jgi:hypothetical protein
LRVITKGIKGVKILSLSFEGGRKWRIVKMKTINKITHIKKPK